MIRHVLVASSLLLAFACSTGGATRPDPSPDETPGAQSKAHKPLPTPLGGLQFAQAPAQPGSYTTLSFAQDGTFAGALVASCADGPCAHPNLAQVSGTWDEDGKSLDVHLELTNVTVAPGTTPACKKVKNVIDLRKDDETLHQVPGTYLSITGNNLCGGPDLSLSQQSVSVVGVGGGTVTTPDGASVTIQSASLPAGVAVTVSADPAAPLPANATPAGTAYLFGPEGQTFARPVTITLPVSLPPGHVIGDVRIFTAPLGSTSFHALQTTVVDATHVAATANHFSVYVAGIPTNCAQELTDILTGATIPPTQFWGWDISNGGGNGSGGSSGTNFGASIEDLDPNGCFTAPVPDVLLGLGGYLDTSFLAAGVNVAYNEQSKVVFVVEIQGVYQSTITFQSRDGMHHFALGLAGATDGGAGFLTVDGAPFTIDWGTPAETTEVNTLYDALCFTFTPSLCPTASVDCLADQTCRASFDPVNGANFGSRTIPFYVDFAQGPDGPSSDTPLDFYSFWQGGAANCNTPDALAKTVASAGISPGQIGTIVLSLENTVQTAEQAGEAESIQTQSYYACGTAAPAPDGAGYSALTWGYEGEVLLEYDTASPNYDFKIFANHDYLGAFSFQYFDQNNNQQNGNINVDSPITFNGTTITGASTDADLTPLSNAILGYYLGINDPSCMAAGDCSVTTNGSGDTVIGFPPIQMYFVLDSSSNVHDAYTTTGP